MCLLIFSHDHSRGYRILTVLQKHGFTGTSSYGEARSNSKGGENYVYCGGDNKNGLQSIRIDEV